MTTKKCLQRLPNGLSENHWSKGEAADGPRWGRNLSGFSKVTNAKALSMAMTCNREERGPETQGRKDPPGSKKQVFLKSCKEVKVSRFCCMEKRKRTIWMRKRRHKMYVKKRWDV